MAIEIENTTGSLNSSYKAKQIETMKKMNFGIKVLLYSDYTMYNYISLNNFLHKKVSIQCLDNYTL